MNKFIVVVFFCAFPLIVLAHPGKTDKYGGHQCIRGCEEWGLFYKEYHLHDKDGKPIRVTKKKKSRPLVEPVSAPAQTIPFMEHEVPKTNPTVTVYRYVTNVYERDIFSYNPLLWALLVLLLLLLIIRVNRNKSADQS